MDELNVCLICRIESVNKIQGSCSVQPLHQPLKDGERITLPPMVNIPIFHLGSGDFIVRVPLKPGDIIPCIIADYDIENLILTGQLRTPNVDDIHNINDAIALPVVLNPFNNSLPSNDIDDLTIQKRNGLSKIVIKAASDEIVIESPVIRLGEGATQGVRLADDSDSTKVLAE